ncbi:MAG: hypothetical protein HKN17_04540 [Rhodothermales bacterium]|nr:hypothetical protein [Rhodothermales bacterium]
MVTAFWFAAVLGCVRPASAQSVAPFGPHIQSGATVFGGIGATAGIVDARTLYTREVHLVSDLEPFFRKSDEQGRVALLLGVGLRLYGFERLIGGVGYRRFDLDVGLRVGPGLSFSTRDTRIERNRRFVLLLEPTVRVSRAVHPARALFVEAGTSRPHGRFGLWQRF